MASIVRLTNMAVLFDLSDCLIFGIEYDEYRNKIAHLYGYGYFGDDRSEKPCRFVEYTWFYADLEEIEEFGLYGVESRHSENFKQYITDCTEEEMMNYYLTYNEGKCPKFITEDEFDEDIPCGIYILLPAKED